MQTVKGTTTPGFKDEAAEVMDMLSRMEPDGHKTLLAFLLGARYGQAIRAAEQERASA